MNQPIPGATLASVLHLRLADFGTKSVVEQARLRAQLEAVVAASLSVVPERDRIVLDAQDGIALAILDNPAGAMNLAQRCLEAAAVMPLCVGAHHGAVAVAGGAGEDALGLIGDGPRAASAAAGFAKPAKMLATHAFREALAAQAPARESELWLAGTFADDSVRTHELYIFDRAGRRQRRRRLLGAGLACMAFGLAAGLGTRLYLSGALTPAPPPPAPATAAAEPVPAPAPAAASAPIPATPAAARATPPAAAPAVAVAKPEAKRPAALPPAVLVFQVTPGGTVLIDGKVRGELGKLKRLELPPGRYQLEIRYGKEAPLKRALDLKSGQQVAIKYEFKPGVFRRFKDIFR